ncbi:hypothetical protein KJ782_04035 [Patescibacteria group bacterium]|nr:hypothetical protein [Patescibacteria group bacterium]
MPELPLEKPKIVSDFADEISQKNVLEKMRQGYESGEDEFATLAKLYPETEYVGNGSQVFVIGHPRDDEKVVAFNIFDGELSRNPIRAMELYHLHRFLHILFPHNFPQFYSVAGGENAQSVRQRVNSSPETPVRFPFSEVVNQSERIGFPLQIDGSAHNFVVASDGGEYYFDTVMTPNSNIFFENFDRSKLVEFMKNQGIDPKSQRRAMNSLKRLRELDVISTIGYVLKNHKSLTEEGFDLSSNNWLDDMIKRDDFRFNALDEGSLNRIKRFTELLEVPNEHESEREKVITYLSKT